MLRLMSMVSALLVSSVLVTAATHAAVPMRSAERDGVRFEYATQLMPKDKVRISGRLTSTGERFDLIVDAAGRVRGDFGGQYVEYNVAPAKHDSIVAALTAPSTSVAAANALQSIAATR